MLIELKKIPEQGMRVERVLDLGPVPEDREIEAIGPASINVYVMEDEVGVYVSGGFRTQVTVPCARCMRLFELPLEGSFDSTFRQRPAGFPKESQVQEADLGLSYLESNQETLDLREVVLEQIILNLPMKPLHIADCKGLCPRCGTDRNEAMCQCPGDEIDPRLEPLARLRASMKEK